MEKYVVKGTNDTPEINLDPDSGIIFIGGSSLPENVLEVYQPVVDWLNQYISSPVPTTEVRFHFDYLNTASSHMIMQLMEKLMELQRACEHFTITWYYDKTDPDMRDFGNELIEITQIPIELKPKEIM